MIYIQWSTSKSSESMLDSYKNEKVLERLYRFINISPVLFQNKIIHYQSELW